jgi:hypothetical protein
MLVLPAHRATFKSCVVTSCGTPVPADVDVRMLALGLGGVGHSVDEPGRRPEVVVEEGLGDDVSPVRCQAGNC